MTPERIVSPGSDRGLWSRCKGAGSAFVRAFDDVVHYPIPVLRLACHYNITKYTDYIRLVLGGESCPAFYYFAFLLLFIGIHCVVIGGRVMSHMLVTLLYATLDTSYMDPYRIAAQPRVA